MGRGKVPIFFLNRQIFPERLAKLVKFIIEKKSHFFLGKMTKNFRNQTKYFKVNIWMDIRMLHSMGY